MATLTGQAFLDAVLDITGATLSGLSRGAMEQRLQDAIDAGMSSNLALASILGANAPLLATTPEGENSLTYLMDVSDEAKQTVIDTPDLFHLTAGEPEVLEGDAGTKTMSFRLELDRAPADTVKVIVTTTGGTASPDEDYLPISQEVTFAPGQTVAFVPVAIIGDTDVEPDETIQLTISGDMLFETIQTVGTILNDDDPQMFDMTVNAPQVVEGDSGARTMTFVLQLDQAPTEAVTFNVETTGGTATPDEDFLPVVSTVNFAAGQTAAQVSVTIIGDKEIEDDETIQLTVSGAQLVADVVTQGTILNDDFIEDLTLILTESTTDNLQGGDGNDLFIGELSAVNPMLDTLHASDVMNGAGNHEGGVDTFRLTSVGTTGVVGFEMTEIEHMELRTYGDTETLTLGMGNVEDLERVISVANSSANAVLDDLGNLVFLEAYGNGTAPTNRLIDLNYHPDVTDGVEDQEILVNRFGTDPAGRGVIEVDGVENVYLTSVGSGNGSFLELEGDFIHQIFLTLDQDLDLSVTDALDTIDRIEAGWDNGIAQFADDPGSLTVDLTGSNRSVTVISGAGNDRITGSSGPENRVYANEGNNWVSMGDGAYNWVYTGSGHDTIIGSTGTYDWIEAGDGNNNVDARTGVWNYIFTGTGNDVIVSNATWQNYIRDTGGFNQITINDDAVLNDIVTGDGGDIILVGDAVNSGGATLANTTIDAGHGNNVVQVGNSEAFIFVTTGDGNDDISVGSGWADISAGGGNDHIRMANTLGNTLIPATWSGQPDLDWVDLIAGGDGYDALHVWVMGDIQSNSLTETTSIEELVFDWATGGIFDAEVLHANAAGVVAYRFARGLDDDAVILNTVNNVWVYVDNHYDVQSLTVEALVDTLDDVANVALYGEMGTLTVDFAETLNLTNSARIFNGNGNVITLNGSIVSDDLVDLNIFTTPHLGAQDINGFDLGLLETPNLETIDAGDLRGFLRVDTTNVTNDLSISTAQTGAFNDVIRTGVGDDYIRTNDGDDIVYAGEGDDEVHAGPGADIVWGQAGADILYANNPDGSGDLAEDWFYYLNLYESSAQNVDTIMDFEQGFDKIMVRESLLEELSPGVYKPLQFAGNGTGAFNTQGLIGEDSGFTEYAFDMSTRTLWIDLNDDGTLNSDDLQIIIPNVAALNADDVESIANVAPTTAGEFYEVDENDILNVAAAGLLANDSDFEGDALTVSEIAYDGTLYNPGDTIVLLSGGELVIDADGAFVFDTNNAYDWLAVGEEFEEIVTYTVSDGNGGFTPADLSITITGSNDDPVIWVDVPAGDSAAATVVENGGPESDTLSVEDLDLSDSVTARVDSVVASNYTVDAPDNADLLNLLTVAPTAIIGGGTDFGSLTWTFDSNLMGTAVDFEYLDKNEALVLTYVVEVEDIHGATDQIDVVITVEGENQAPVITVESGDTTGFAFLENGPGYTGSGTLTVVDPDLSDVVVPTVEAVAYGMGSALTGLLSDNTELLAMMTVGPPEIDADAGDVNNLNWAFDSGSEDFNYLADGEYLYLEYTIRGTENEGLSPEFDEQIITIEIEGTNDAPVFSVEVGDSDTAGLVDTIDPDDFAAQSGTLTLVDPDYTDTVGIAQHNISTRINGVDTDISGILPNPLSGMLIVGSPVDADPETLIPTPADVNNVAWEFDPALGDFDFLQAGETLEIVYTLIANDGNGGTDTHDITVTIEGANDAPIVEFVTAEETGSQSGTFTLLASDPDNADILLQTAINGQDELMNDGTNTVFVVQQQTASVVSTDIVVTDGSLLSTDPTLSTPDPRLTLTQGTSGDDNMFPPAAGWQGVYFGFEGNDTILGGDQDDILFGGDGNDILRGGPGADYMDGGDGDDKFAVLGIFDPQGTGGTNDYDPYTDAQILTLINAAGLTGVVTLAELRAGNSVDESAGTEIVGGNGNDTLYGFGTVNLAAATVNNTVNNLGLFSHVELTLAQLNNLETISFYGNGPHSITLTNGTISDYEAWLNQAGQQFFMVGADDPQLTVIAQDGTFPYDGYAEMLAALAPYSNEAGIYVDLVNGSPAFDMSVVNEPPVLIDGPAISTTSEYEIDFIVGDADNDVMTYTSPFGAHSPIFNSIVTTFDATQVATVAREGMLQVEDGVNPAIDIAYVGLGDFTGGMLNDVLNASASTLGAYLWGFSGNDTLTGSDHDDYIHGGSGDDTLYGGLGNDYIIGDTTSSVGNDTLYGEEGDDTLLGRAGDDTLYGGDGSDDLDGGAGNDDLYGGFDADTLTGGSGADVFNFADLGFNDPATGTTSGDYSTSFNTMDVITDFNSAQGDKINLGPDMLTFDYAETLFATTDFATLRANAEDHLIAGVDKVYFGVYNGDGYLFWDDFADGSEAYIQLQGVTDIAPTDITTV